MPAVPPTGDFFGRRVTVLSFVHGSLILAADSSAEEGIEQRLPENRALPRIAVVCADEVDAAEIANAKTAAAKLHIMPRRMSPAFQVLESDQAYYVAV